jgi:hypothetical protein
MEPDWNDIDSVLWSFVNSLMRNDVEMVKSLTAPELWNRVDFWVVKHEALQGRVFSSDPDDNRVFQDCIPCSHEGITATCCNYSLHSTYEGRAYHFAVREVALWKTKENGYLIVAWDEICESKGGEYPSCD